MGCDIHGYIEKGLEMISPVEGEIETSVMWMAHSKLSISRDYRMFTHLAGVRGSSNKAFIAPRGVPGVMGHLSDDDYWFYIHKDGVGDHVTPDQAAKWVESGSSVEKKNHSGEVKWVSNPDAHTASWYSAEEFTAAMAAWRINIDENVPADFAAIEASLNSLKDHGYKARFVFWFDN